jgi:hypothetical protein
MTVDEFVKTKVLPEYRDIVSMLRELMHEMAPDVKEVMSYGIPVYKRKRISAKRASLAPLSQSGIFSPIDRRIVWLFRSIVAQKKIFA